jgi:SAM-dependent methyltransferase
VTLTGSEASRAGLAPDIRPWARGLSLSADGLWRATTPAARVSYPEGGHDLLAPIEATSFWFGHRNDCLLRLLERCPPPGLLFDVGGGNGFVTRALTRHGIAAVMVEPGEGGARNARARGVATVICAGFEEADFPDRSLPAVGLFDVLEHVAAEQSFLRAVRAKLAPTGRLYLTVPAYGWLWSEADGYAGHHRRYTRGRLTRALTGAGFQVEFVSYFFSFLVVPVLLSRALPYRAGWRCGRRVGQDEAAHAPPTGLKGALLRRLQRWECERIGVTPLPFGASCLAVARPAAEAPPPPGSRTPLCYDQRR